MKSPDQIRDFFLCSEEYLDAAVYDKHKRFVPNPKVDYSVPIVSHFLKNNGFSPQYPNGKKFAVCISHDIDRMFTKPWSLKTILNQQARALVHGDVRKFSNNITHIKRKIAPENSLERWLDIENKFNIKATYFFMSLSMEEEDFNYDPTELKDLYRQVLNSGHEIGLHGGHEAFNSYSKMKLEKDKLEAAVGSPVTAYRNHYLKFDINSTWKALHKAGFMYDATYGFAQVPGFRNGMAHPFKVGIESLDEDGFYALPLHIMDATLQNYLSLDIEKSFEHCRTIIDRVVAVGGVLSLLWHNNNSSLQQLELYYSILEYLQQLDAWFATGGSVIDHYKHKEYFEEINLILGLNES